MTWDTDSEMPLPNLPLKSPATERPSRIVRWSGREPRLSPTALSVSVAPPVYADYPGPCYGGDRQRPWLKFPNRHRIGVK